MPVERDENPNDTDGVVDDPALVADEFAIEQNCNGGDCTPMPSSMLLKLRVFFLVAKCV